ncbi:sugar phosphate isomerase/epimerase [Maribacter polysiphoniae]|uniref:Sugar phosphate isomerase/epimerase n=1 Tax=Maribacter polysiphoniae TaxID=429344 RepID=A0A316DX99_9FLAO|nr:TIM barrel protein [Maribacter polysiphoniae]MBD1261661.1 sugar phosphate isomerase/epimerase [Maribacter polysiphoniae]PWK22535.1 sugar phosphate isomerase/epimerase [Maribacter polysiphoniae]
MSFTRRKFIKVTSATAAGVGIVPTLAAQLIPSPIGNNVNVNVFSKCLQFLNYEELGETLAKLGFSGADLTVRNNGHVLPENVKRDLPKAVKALQKAGVDAPMIVTGINDANDRLTEDILGTAADSGITYYRMGYYKFDDKLSVFQNLDNCKRRLEKLEKLNRKYNIKVGYQNHSGPWGMVGGAVWDLHYILKDFDPEYVGVQYDIAHSMVEGGYSWEIALKIIEPWINSLAIKDFLWKKGEKRWEPEWVPLGEGMVDFKKYADDAQRLLTTKPITIHCEYDLGGAEFGRTNPTMSPKDIYRKLTDDLHYFNNKLLKS